MKSDPLFSPFTQRVNRRHFLKAGTLTAASVSFLNGTSRAANPIPAPCASEAWTKHGELFRHTGEPVGGWIQNFTSPAEPLDGGRWRLWVGLSGDGSIQKNIGFAEGSPGGEWEVTWADLSPDAPGDTALSIGDLPNGWRPVQTVHLQLQDGRHRLYFWAHGDGEDGHVVRYLAADSQDGRRYRVVNALQPCLYHISDRAAGGDALAEMGLTRRAKQKARLVDGESPAPSHLICNDATNVYQLPDGSFELFTVGVNQVEPGSPGYIDFDNMKGYARVIHRYVSADGLHWEGPQPVILPDEKDPADQQFYYLSVTHTDRGRVGILGHYRVASQTIDMEWCFSEDGVNWHRPHRSPWLERGGPGSIERYMIYPPNQMIYHQDQWWLFYTGANFNHNKTVVDGAKDRAILLATTPSIWA